ncbi:MAG: cytochrome c3 family protein [Syntrophobacteria bacterium]
MKRLILLVSVVSIVAIFVNVQKARAVDDVTSTKHNILNVVALDPGYYTGTVAAYGEVCVFCHTPHNSNSAATDAPLWNRNVNTAGYTPYDSPTIDTGPIGQPTGVSVACLSCHDGTIGLDVVVNQPGSAGDTGGIATSGMLMRDTSDANFNPRLTQVLSDDHPVSMQYPTAAQDPMFNAIASASTAGLRFFGGGLDEVQCASCHNPHEATNEKFLRLANTNSDLCKTCHIK